MRNPLLLLAAALILSACGSGRPASSAGGSRPSWIEGESARFPRSRFVVGVGSADSEADAGDRARGEVAKVFQANVSVDDSSEETETAHGAVGGAETRSFAQSVASRVRTTAEKALEGVDVVERWRDPQTGRHYALAALPKDRALLAVTEKAHELDAEAGRWKGALAGAADRFERAKAAAKLLALAKGRAALEADSRVLGGGRLEGGFDAGAARAEAAKALAALEVVVSVDGEGSEELMTGIVSGLAASGFSARRGPASGKADLVAESSVAVAPGTGGDQRWKWSRATATVTLKDGRDDRAFARFDVADRQAAGDEGEARRRALAGLAKKAAEKVKSSIDAYFENQ